MYFKKQKLSKTNKYKDLNLIFLPYEQPTIHLTLKDSKHF